jgi:hypothetical protein
MHACDCQGPQKAFDDVFARATHVQSITHHTNCILSGRKAIPMNAVKTYEIF